MPDSFSVSTSSGDRSRSNFSRVTAFLLALHHRDLVGVVGDLARVVLVIVIDGAVDVEELGPRQDVLEAVQDETVLAIGLIGLAALSLEPLFASSRLHLSGFVVAVAGVCASAAAGIDTVGHSRTGRNGL